ncbi:YbaB/EbfC family nucleoid-associated protein [Streptomyces griseorubiginosus]|uniref:YbaB/EbfC family nucleoid-associated protein n=1 Tax=Streptomyces griseorubiginosus TaxID=67304 RepID=UPI001FCBE2F5|nr:YbaB/EbfC family nucleoid-associated protein [Streptomyces griseorubiginosus]
MTRQQNGAAGPVGPGDPLEQRLGRAMEELEQLQGAVARAEKRMNDFSAVVVSRDGAVQVSVGPRGELTDLKFLDGKYREMSAPQLAAAVLDAVEEGRHQATREVMRLFKPLTDASSAIVDLPGTDFDWDRLLGRQDSSRAGRESTWQAANARLRDEISEDDE